MTCIAYIIDPIDSLKEQKDSTIELMREAAKRGYQTKVAHADSLMFDGKKVTAQWQTLEIHESKEWYRITDSHKGGFEGIDIVLMRKDPPFDAQYLYTTLLLSYLPESVRVINCPRALRDHNEKLALLEFLDFAPETVVTLDRQKIDQLIDRLGDVIIKPLHGMGGEGIFRIRHDDPNRHMIVDLSTKKGKQRIMIQRYLPEVVQGDKRVLVINGQPIDYSLARIPQSGDARANLAAGGQGVAMALTERERTIAEAVGQRLVGRGLYLIGLDMIGETLTEINVTSPTCFVEIRQQTGFNVAACFWDRLGL